MAPVPPGATSGNVVVTVSNVASNGVNFTVGTTVSAGPTLVQHVSSSNNRSISFGFPNCYYFQLPNPTTQGNAVIVGFTFSNNPTPTVTDDQNNSYAIAQNYYDSADNQSVAIAAAFNVSAGARNISVCFSSDPGAYVQPMATEFDNVIAVDGSGTGSNGTGTSVTAGSLQPTLSGDLAYQIVFSLSVNQSSFTAGSQGNIGWNLLSADLMDGWAGQYGVYDSTSVINPTMSMGTAQNWVTGAILLQQGSAGSVPSGMRIVHMVHENIPYNIYAGGTETPFPNPLPLQFPASGNLLVAMIGGGDESETITSMTDTNNNTWSQAGSTFIAPNSDTVQTYYAGNATSSSNLGLTLNWTGTSGDFTIFLYDVTGAANSPLDTTTGATGNQDSTNGTLTTPYTLAPAQSGELIFTDIMWEFNTATGLTSNPGTSYFDTNTFSGESLSGPEPVDENNGWGHVISTSTSPISFTWPQLDTSLPAGNWASMVVAFLPAGNQNSQPVATPTFSPAAGTYGVAQSVTISDVTAGAQIYYTTDGSIPSTASTLYDGTAIVVSTTTTIQAIAVASGLPNSAVGSATYTIQTTSQPPSITSAAGATFVVGTQGTFTVTATGTPTPTLAESGALPSGVTFDIATGVLGGTPLSGTGGAYNPTFTASNGVGTNATQSFALTVNEAPAITSANNTTFTVGSAGTFTLTASGYPAAMLSESGALPTGVTFNPTTGVLSGTPAANTGGVYNITFAANNGVGVDPTQNFTLTVTASTEPPLVVSVTPSSGSGSGPQTFSFVYSDPNGFTYLNTVQALFSATGSSSNSCWLRYVQAANSLYLMNDAGTSWTGPMTPGAVGTLQNSQCSVDVGNSSASGSGNSLTLNLLMTFNSSFAGPQSTWMKADDNGGQTSGWQIPGSWSVPPAVNQPPSVLSVTPSSGSGSGPQTFSFVYSDPNGFTYLNTVQALFSATGSSSNSCWLRYVQAANSLYLMNDAGTSWTGPMTPGAVGTLQNSQCSVDVGNSSASGSGNSLTLNLLMTFNSSFAGPQSTWMKADDNGGQTSGWQIPGSWSVPPAVNQPPSVLSVTPSSGSGSGPQTFSFVYSDPNGFTYLNTVLALFSATGSSSNSCWLRYVQAANSLYLIMMPGPVGRAR